MARDPAEEWLQRLHGRQVLALSPHPDDVAFSIGGLLRRLAALAEVTVVSVFTRNAWAPNLDPRRRDPDTVSRLRQAEDVQYCRRVRARRLALELADAGLRGYNDRTERLGTRADDGAAAAVTAALVPLVRGRGTLLCPLGLGGHVDHEIVRAAALAAARGRRRAWFYEDLPYARYLGEPEIAEHVRRVAGAARPHCFRLTPARWRRKLEDVEVYRTQVRARDRDDLLAHARRAAGERGLAERLWLP